MSLLDDIVAKASYKVNFVCLGSVVFFGGSENGDQPLEQGKNQQQT